MLFNPAFAMLFNVKDKRWHPILFTESPLPGPPEEGKPIRLKSHGHHTTGFETRELALAGIKEASGKLDVQPIVDVREDIPWNGEDTPAMVAFLDGDKLIFF